ncbi:hypothetical protein E1292_12580 [Nonomuraea deserti]|uniref:Uncharacterized protein n=1 Tax=Nonomuraea deserti TaxID=1848322 RepID=A0A4V2YBI4_9ACTN|nr:hypothetical protein [Nonomuraea deserti]TDD07726.1 hypothetical protein E1292_12580 [Nonomuraea deserti]
MGATLAILVLWAAAWHSQQAGQNRDALALRLMAFLVILGVLAMTGYKVVELERKYDEVPSECFSF